MLTVNGKLVDIESISTLKYFSCHVIILVPIRWLHLGEIHGDQSEQNV